MYKKEQITNICNKYGVEVYGCKASLPNKILFNKNLHIKFVKELGKITSGFYEWEDFTNGNVYLQLM